MSGLGRMDPVSHGGFTPDGAFFGGCQTQASAQTIPEFKTECVALPRNGSAIRAVSPFAREAPQGSLGPIIDPFLREHALPSLDGYNNDPQYGWGTFAPELRGEWAFSDIALVADAEAQGKRGAFVRLGGRVADSPTSYVIAVERERPFPDGLEPDRATLAALQISPDGNEIGLLVFFDLAPELLVARRMPLVRLAAQIYNDEGMRMHRKRSYAAAQVLFTKSVYADRSFALAAYNLACALARQTSPHTEAALENAVAVGGAQVRARARRDADFAAFKDATWLR